MLLGLAPLALALASATPESDTLICQAGFADHGRIVNVFLVVDGEYTPRAMNAWVNEPDGWSRADIALDPMEPRLPGLFSGAFFAVRYTRTPVFPLTLSAYADGTLRWRKAINVPFWPTILGGTAESARAGRDPGTGDYVSRADDGLPVPTPRELRIVLTDARGQPVGETRFMLPGAEPDGPMARALATVEAGYRAHNCFPPPPPID